jgi:hypothetical protein
MQIVAATTYIKPIAMQLIVLMLNPSDVLHCCDLDFLATSFPRSPGCPRAWLFECLLSFFLCFLESIGMTTPSPMISLLAISTSPIEQPLECPAVHEYSLPIPAICTVRSSSFSEALNNPCCNTTRLLLIFIRELCVWL